MNNAIIVAVAVIVVAAGGGYYAFQAGYLDLQVPTQESAQELTPLAPEIVDEEPVEEVVIEEPVEEVVEEVGTPIEGHENTVEDFKEEVRLCESDADCKIQSIGCNGCDCGRAVNNWIDSVCTGDEEIVCPNLVCPASKAVCNSGVCEKVEL